MIRVGVAGAAGRMGETVCAAVEAAPTWSWWDAPTQARLHAHPNVGASFAEVIVDFTRPDSALENALLCLRKEIHVVIGTTGFDLQALTEQARAIAATQGDTPANLLVAPNFAIGAVLMMRFAAEAAKHMAKAEIVELHHDGKIDAPSGTAARTAQLMAMAAGGEPHRSIPCACRGW